MWSGLWGIPLSPLTCLLALYWLREAVDQSKYGSELDVMSIVTHGSQLTFASKQNREIRKRDQKLRENRIHPLPSPSLISHLPSSTWDSSWAVWPLVVIQGLGPGAWGRLATQVQEGMELCPSVTQNQTGVPNRKASLATQSFTSGLRMRATNHLRPADESDQCGAIEARSVGGCVGVWLGVGWGGGGG